MKYSIKIDKYVKDRFKIFKEDELVYIGEKVGDASSYFDAFIGETFAKGAHFLFFNKKEDEILKIERNFYDKNKEYKLYEMGKDMGYIKSTLGESIVEINIDYKKEKMDFKLSRNDNILKLKKIGTIISKKQGFRSYEEMEMELEDQKYEILLLSLSVYIWDVLIKNKIAFV